MSVISTGRIGSRTEGDNKHGVAGKKADMPARQAVVGDDRGPEGQTEISRHLSGRDLGQRYRRDPGMAD